MGFFEYYFKDMGDEKEVAVCCPFPHHLSNGGVYYEENPSAHINTENRLYHCKVCGKGLSEVSFIAELLGCKYETAVSLQRSFLNTDDMDTWKVNVIMTPEIRQLCNSLGISDSTIQQLNIGTETGDDIAFPVFMFDKIVDVRSYRPNTKTKIRSRLGAMSGLIIPYDVWRDSSKQKWTLICAGEKDMAVARSNGFNAITITGGERALPQFFKDFKDRKVAILYDNDDAGILGAKTLAANLLEYTKEVRVVTNFHEVCKERGEDITDFFTKYDGTKAQLQHYIINTPVFTEEEADEVNKMAVPLISLLEASKPQYINRLVQSNIQVVATFEKAMPVPTTIHATKLNVSGNDEMNKMLVGQHKTWQLTENNCQDILKLIDNNFTEEQIRVNIRNILQIHPKESSIKIEKPTKDTVYQCSVTDLFEATTEDVVPMEFSAYALHKRLESGKKYLIKYKLVPHPYKGQQLTMIILDAKDASDSVSKFKITDTTKHDLELFQNIEGSVPERIEKLTEMFKSFIDYDGFNKLIQAIDLSYHTVLEFNFGNKKNVRGYLDTIVVAESRVGKSSTAEALQKLYKLGAFTDLAGNSATIPGLIGGSSKVNGNFQTRAGLIPMNHRGLVIFEELAKCNSNLIRELTSIRSSNQVRIARVSGSLSLPALVRMITLTNVKTRGGHIRPISSYPNGIEILIDLIGSAEDIARYDLMLIMGELGNKIEDPLWEVESPLPERAYQTRVRWVWSRSADQVIISNDMARYIVNRCNVLNEKYAGHIKIFGTEAWKKISRLAIAVAGYLVSTDDTYENIIVKEEHVDFAIDYLVDCYDNSTFKLKEYVDMERLYNTIDTDGIALLQEIYQQNPSIVLQLEKVSSTNKANLMAITGLDSELYNKLMQKMTQGLFITFNGNDIIPTQRFRLGMSRINRNTRMRRVGEVGA